MGRFLIICRTKALPQTCRLDQLTGATGIVVALSLAFPHSHSLHLLAVIHCLFVKAGGQTVAETHDETTRRCKFLHLLDELALLTSGHISKVREYLAHRVFHKECNNLTHKIAVSHECRLSLFTILRPKLCSGCLVLGCHGRRWTQENQRHIYPVRE